MRLWKNNPETPEGKYLIQRRDGSIPRWPSLVLGGADPATPAGLRAYAAAARLFGYDPDLIEDIEALALECEQWIRDHGVGDPDAPRHRVDDPAVVALMRQGRAS